MSFWWCDLPPSAHLYTSLYTTNGQPRWPFFYMQFPPFTFLSGQLWAWGRRALLDCGGKVEVLARVDGLAVFCRQGPVTVAAFHPELTGDTRLHERFVEAL